MVLLVDLTIDKEEADKKMYTKEWNSYMRKNHSTRLLYEELKSFQPWQLNPFYAAGQVYLPTILVSSADCLLHWHRLL